RGEFNSPRSSAPKIYILFWADFGRSYKGLSLPLSDAASEQGVSPTRALHQDNDLRVNFRLYLP
ncbi:hypothetical protein, partial [Moorena sp. SIO3A2]